MTHRPRTSAPALLVACLAAALATLVGCAPEAPPPAPAGSPPATGTGMPSVAAADVDELQGSVREVLDADHYTYLRLGLGDRDQWVVVMGTPQVDRGDVLDVTVYGVRHDFPSRRLNRSFDELFFGRIRSST